MALRITNGEVDGIAVVWLDGRIVLGEETGALRDKVKNLMAHGKKNLILNMNNVTLIDSAGLGALVAAYSSAKSGGAIADGSATWERSSTNCCKSRRLITLFDVYNTQADAINSFSK